MIRPSRPHQYPLLGFPPCFPDTSRAISWRSLLWVRLSTSPVVADGFRPSARAALAQVCKTLPLS
ncbi:hypothetical protein FZI91_11865 [Mycobacterium sp. CBMA271]|nr:hypothetical protein [Mycobacteroides sp. CBMA 271]